MTLQASMAKTPNPKVTKSRRLPKENNLRWLERHWGPADGRTRLVLVGGTGPIDFRLRAAQAVVRHDFSPSNWSHVALAGPRARSLGRTSLVEISLSPRGGFGEPPKRNALQRGVLARYADEGHFPNIAVFSLSVPFDDVEAWVPRLEKQRTTLDLVELTVTWLAHAWGVGAASNPLEQQHGVPSAAAVEALLSANGFDVSPGLTSRASSPEAIWQGCRWWHQYSGGERERDITGAFAVSHVMGQGPRKEREDVTSHSPTVRRR